METLEDKSDTNTTRQATVADYTTRKNYQSNYSKTNRDAINSRKRAWRAARKVK